MQASLRIVRWTATLGAALGLCAAAGAADRVLINPFHDPFEQVTRAAGACPAPQPPSYTEHDMHLAEHHRVEQGNSCYLAGRCRYSSSFDYDAGIARALSARLRAAPELRGSSVWILVQGRFVQLQGCVRDAAQARAAEAIARATPDVQAVLPELRVGARGQLPYTPASAPR
ncbi:MAG: BON domain-containing protein [Betaproteobacteria bacterium]|nr:BON domain-containing protein [Betaproteobacteria bacterium]MDE2150875.1 BON domain-containing protein [Betaproteobacteria bacterium]